jgi:hypothetical protein
MGNLATEKTSVAEIKEIFSKYGTIMEDPTLRRSFGFVQYDNALSAATAISCEQGRVIGGLKICL